MLKSPSESDSPTHDYVIQGEGTSRVAAIILSNDNTISAEELLRLDKLIEETEGPTRLKINDVEFVVVRVPNKSGEGYSALTVLDKAGNEVELDCTISPETAGKITLRFNDKKIHKIVEGKETLLYPRMDQVQVIDPKDLGNLAM